MDVSSVKELVRRWYPTVRAQRPRKVGSHRALDDIQESVAELRYYRERVFRPPDPRPPDPRPSADGVEVSEAVASPPVDPSTELAAGGG